MSAKKRHHHLLIFSKLAFQFLPTLNQAVACNQENFLNTVGVSDTLHSRSGETVGNWVGNQLPAGWDTRLEWGYFQFLAVAYTQKAQTWWAISTTSGGLAI